MSAEFKSKDSKRLQIFSSLLKSESSPTSKPFPVRKDLKALGIKGLLNTIEAHSRKVSIKLKRKGTLEAATPTMAEISPSSGTKCSTQSNIQTYDASAETGKKPSRLSLRDKRLMDLQAYKVISVKDLNSSRASPSLENQSNPISRTSSPMSRAASTATVKRRRNINLTTMESQTYLGQTFSIEPIPIENTSPSIVTGSILQTTGNNFPNRKGESQNKEDSMGMILDESQQVPVTKPFLYPRRSASTTIGRRREGLAKLVIEKSPVSTSHIMLKDRSMSIQTNLKSTLEVPDNKYVSKTPVNKEKKIIKEIVKEYAERATSPMPKLKPRFDFKKKSDSLGYGEDSEEMRKNRNSILLQLMKPIYSHFITEKFNEDMMDRLNTFYAFAFTKDEKNENQEVKLFFNDVNRGKDIAGTMSLVDLWSQKMRMDVARKAKFAREKHMLEKFAFYTSDIRKVPAKVKPARIIHPKASDSMDKHKVAVMELRKSAEKNQEYALMSPMRRHKVLKGKTFYEPKETTKEAMEAVLRSNELNQELGTILNHLNKFEEENQEDYEKLVGFIKEVKTNPKLNGAKGMKQILYIKNHLPKRYSEDLGEQTKMESRSLL